MSTRKPTRIKPVKLSPEEHQRIGAELARIRAFLIQLSCRVPNTYGKKDRAARLALTVFETVDSLRSEMEDHCARDCPEEDHTEIYYPQKPDQWTFDMRLMTEEDIEKERQWNEAQRRKS